MLQILFILVSAGNLWSATDTQALATKVIELRKEVEILNDEYKTEREKVLSDLKSLSVQKAELAANIRNEESRRDQMSGKIAKYKGEMQKTSLESDKLQPVLLTTIEGLKQHINGSLPFKKGERLEAITGIEERIKSKEISPTAAANQLWALIEDEKRLSRETSLHKQTITLNDKIQLAEVAKVGMLFLYFKTDGAEVGVAQKENDQWTYKSFSDAAQQKQVLAFFESFKKQIRQGYFEIPTSI